jgi:endoglycosylceramidase
MAKRILVYCFLVALSVSAPVHVDPETNMFVDDTGRERFYHGLNVIYKKDPWYAPFEGYDVNTTFSDIDMKMWEEWGFNAVRLQCQWPGFEPE